MCRLEGTDVRQVQSTPYLLRTLHHQQEDPPAGGKASGPSFTKDAQQPCCVPSAHHARLVSSFCRRRIVLLRLLNQSRHVARHRHSYLSVLYVTPSPPAPRDGAVDGLLIASTGAASCVQPPRIGCHKQRGDSLRACLKRRRACPAVADRTRQALYAVHWWPTAMSTAAHPPSAASAAPTASAFAPAADGVAKNGTGSEQQVKRGRRSNPKVKTGCTNCKYVL